MAEPTVTEPGVRGDPRRALAVLGVLSVVVSAAGVALAAGPGGRSWSGLMHDNVLNNAANGLYLGLLGGLLVWLRPRNAVSWLILTLACANAVTVFGEGWGLASYVWHLPLRVPLVWLGSWVWAAAFAGLAAILPLIYPNGRPTDRLGRRLLAAALAAIAFASIGFATSDTLYRQSVPGHDLGHNPLSGGHLQPLAEGIALVGSLATFVLALAAWGHTLWRLRHAASPEREQLAWLLVAIIPAIVGSFFLPSWAFFVLNAAPVGLLIGITRYQLFDVKPVLRSGLLYGLLLALAVGAYFGVVALITLVTPRGTIPSLFAAAAVALLVVPAYRWLTGAVGRLVYGDRADPVRALGRMTGTDLDAMVAAVATSVRSPHVAVRTVSGEVVAECGRASGHPAYEVPLRYDGADVGTLAVAWRTATDRFSATDRTIVDALAAPVAVALHASRLAAQVGEVRATERRQLRNDLHDGLGPSLSGVALGIEAALKAGDDGRVREILGVVHGEVTGLVSEVRHLIDGLGPAGLEHGDLVAALRAQAEAVTALGGVVVSVEAAPLPTLPGAVVLGLHRVGAEALTNVLRHAGAEHAWVRIVAERGAVHLVVEDDGAGIRGAPAGVGRSSMAERVSALGGRLTVAERGSGGTVVTAVVPMEVADG